jgi:hypothetical protein
MKNPPDQGGLLVVPILNKGSALVRWINGLNTQRSSQFDSGQPNH